MSLSNKVLSDATKLDEVIKKTAKKNRQPGFILPKEAFTKWLNWLEVLKTSAENEGRREWKEIAFDKENGILKLSLSSKHLPSFEFKGKWADATALTGQKFCFSWRRCLKAETQGKEVGHLFMINPRYREDFEERERKEMEEFEAQKPKIIREQIESLQKQLEELEAKKDS